MDAEFIALITQSQRQLLAYLRTLTQTPQVADELLQRTNLVLWDKREQFEPGTSFTAWACRVAYFEVLAHRKQQQRERSKLTFDDELLKRIADRSAEWIQQLDPRRGALESCVQKLGPAERQMLERRHLEDWSVKQLAEHDTRSEKGIYKALARIHALLRNCIRSHLSLARLS